MAINIKSDFLNACHLMTRMLNSQQLPKKKELTQENVKISGMTLKTLS